MDHTCYARLVPPSPREGGIPRPPYAGGGDQRPYTAKRETTTVHGPVYPHSFPSWPGGVRCVGWGRDVLCTRGTRGA